MSIPAIATATRAEEDRVASVLTLAFGTDPVVRWMYSEPLQVLTSFPSFVRAFGGSALDHGSAYCVEGYLGAALWLPPDVHPDEAALAGLFESTVAKTKRKHLFDAFEEMGKYHPAEPHWYMPLIGIDPAQQGKGLGSALMRRALSVCDRDNALAYLESSNPRNVPFYEQHGYELLGTIEQGTCPPLFPMLRRPR